MKVSVIANINIVAGVNTVASISTTTGISIEIITEAKVKIRKMIWVRVKVLLALIKIFLANLFLLIRKNLQ